MEKRQSKKPLIRFPEFKDAWEHKQLNELLSEAKKRNEDLKYDKDEVLSVSGELGIVNQIEHLGRSYAGVSVHQYHVVDYGDIVYTKSPLKANPFGIIKLNKGKAGIVSTLYAVYKVNQQTAYGPFIDYYFSLDANTNRYLRPLVKKGAKNDMKINNAYVLNDRIFAPTILEQKRIASFFTVLDKKIAELKQKKSLLEQYKKGVMQKLFSQELRFKDDNGKEFPKWEIKKLGDLVEINSGQSPSNYELYESGKYPFLKVEELNNCSKYQISSRQYSNSNRGLIEPFSIIFPKRGAAIMTNKVRINTESVLMDSNLMAIKSNDKILNVEFLYYKITFEELHKIADTSSIPQINNKHIVPYKIAVPSIVEQKKIADFLHAIDNKIETIISQIQQTQKYKKGLLQNMFI